MNKDGLIVKISDEEFARREIGDKLNVIHQVVKSQQQVCFHTVEKYDSHFKECDELVETCNETMEMLTAKINELKDSNIQEIVKTKLKELAIEDIRDRLKDLAVEEIKIKTVHQIVDERLKELAIPRIYKKRDIGIGLIAGSGSGVGVWEGCKFIYTWIKGLIV